MYKLFCACIAFGISFGASAQQLGQFTQNMDNQIFVNPAYAGYKGCLNISAIHRQQWVGLQGSPKSSLFSFHTPLKYKNMALGVSFLNDQLGPLNQNSFAIDYAYRIKLNKNNAISLGLKTSIDAFSINLNAIDQTGIDPLAGDFRNKITPSFGLGIQFSGEKYYVGLAAPKFTNAFDQQLQFLTDAKHGYLIAGYLFPINRKVIIRPSLQVKVTKTAPLSFEPSITGIFNDMVWLGITARINESIGAFAQFEISKAFKVGYAYDFNYSGLRDFNNGSHEILLSYSLVKKAKNIVSPRYF